MTDLVKRARAALEGVTEGPWHRPDLYFSEVQQDDAESVATCWHEGFDGKTVTLHCIHPCSIEESAANARFIAAARQLVPEMANRIEELEAAIDSDHSRDKEIWRYWSDKANELAQENALIQRENDALIKEKEALQILKGATE